jgi:hypothetical protein
MSLEPGEPLDVHVATRDEAPCFADIYRVVGCCDAGFDPKLRFVARAPVPVTPTRYTHTPDRRGLAFGACDAEGCGWPADRLLAEIPSSWSSGLYLIQFTSAEEPTGHAAERLGEDALFVLRAAAPRAPALLQLGVATWSAYHLWGNRNLYGGLAPDGGWHHSLRTPRVSFHRPGVGLGVFNKSTWAPPKSSYAFKFIQWAEQEGLDVDYCTGLDLHAGTVALERYQVLLTVGHDEYWTGPQRDAVERFVGGGGNAAFFGGNLAYWQVNALENGRVVECYKRASVHGGLDAGSEPLDPRYRDPVRYPEHDNRAVTVEFFADPVRRSTTSLTGVSMRHDAEPPADGPPVVAGAAWWWEDLGGPARPALGLTVCDPHHWALEGLSLQAGDVFGASQKVVGFECDGLDVEVIDGTPLLTGRDDPLPGTHIVAYADAREWGEIDYAGPHPVRVPGQRITQATMGGIVTVVSIDNESGGQIFTAPMTDWPYALVPTIDYTSDRMPHPPVNPACEVCRHITRAAIRRLSGPTHRRNRDLQ